MTEVIGDVGHRVAPGGLQSRLWGSGRKVTEEDKVKLQGAHRARRDLTSWHQGGVNSGGGVMAGVSQALTLLSGTRAAPRTCGALGKHVLLGPYLQKQLIG